MTEYVKAWQCIGCGKIEAPQTCIGVCQDRKVQFVYAFEHEQVLAQARRAQQQAEALEGVVRRLAFTTPRNGEWERSYRALQDQARRALSPPADDAPERRGLSGASQAAGGSRAARKDRRPASTPGGT